MIYKVADFYFDCINVSDATRIRCKRFLCENPDGIDCKIMLMPEDIEAERRLSDKTAATRTPEHFFEGMALYRKMCEYALTKDAFLMHGALVEHEGKGYLFTAKSGTGKTTHIRLWKKLFGDDKVTVVNGDKPIIRFIDGKVYAYGTPWNGKEHYGTNGRVELSAICFLERGEENSIKKISDIEALPRIFSQIMIHDSTDLGKQMELVDRLFEKVPMYLLKCNMDVDAARVSYEGMNEVE